MKHLLFFLLLINLTPAQIDSTSSDYFVEDIIEENVSDVEDENLYEIYEELLSKPINLNTADRSDLMQIPFIDDEMVEKILAHRNKIHKYYSTKELYLIDGLDVKDVKRIIPFLSAEVISSGNLSRPLFGEINIFNRMRYFQKNDPDETGKYLGNNLKAYHRIILDKKEFGSAGFIIEKDPGENNFNDYQSFYLEYLSDGFIKHFIAGDYYVEFGQGLVLWRPYAFTKGSDVISPFCKKSRNLIANKSANENGFFRGIGLELSHSGFSLKMFYSDNFRDATLNGNNEINTIVNTGYHRTENELDKKHNINEKSIGGILSYKSNLFDISFLAYQLSYSNDLAYKNAYSLYGNDFNFISLSYNLYLGRTNITAEWAYNNLSVASINSIRFDLTRDIKLLLSVRNYPRNFSTIYGNAIGERSGNQNEFGFYSGIRYSSPVGTFSFYYDKYKIPYSWDESGFPSSGNEFLVFYESKEYRSVKIKSRYKYETREIINRNGDLPFDKIQHSMRLQVYYKSSPVLLLQSGIFYSGGIFEQKQNTEDGYLFYQDIKYMYENFSLNARICFHKTDSYNSRIYMYENDLRGVMTNLPFYHEGYKWYFLLSYRPVNWLNISVKYSNHFMNEEMLSTGQLKEYGKNISRISIQLDNSFQ